MEASDSGRAPVMEGAIDDWAAESAPEAPAEEAMLANASLVARASTEEAALPRASAELAALAELAELMDLAELADRLRWLSYLIQLSCS